MGGGGLKIKFPSKYTMKIATKCQKMTYGVVIMSLVSDCFNFNFPVLLDTLCMKKNPLKEIHGLLILVKCYIF